MHQKEQWFNLGTERAFNFVYSIWVFCKLDNTHNHRSNFWIEQDLFSQNKKKDFTFCQCQSATLQTKATSLPRIYKFRIGESTCFKTWTSGFHNRLIHCTQWSGRNNAEWERDKLSKFKICQFIFALKYFHVKTHLTNGSEHPLFHKLIDDETCNTSWKQIFLKSHLR